MITYFLLHNQLLATINYPENPNDLRSNILRRNTLILDLHLGEIVARRYCTTPCISGWDIRYAHSGFASFFNNQDLTTLLDILPDPILAHELLCRDGGRFRQDINLFYAQEL